MLSDDLKGLAKTISLGETDGLELTPGECQALAAEIGSFGDQAEALERRPVPDFERVNDAALREGLYGPNVLKLPPVPVRVIDGGRDLA